uniref:Uncharacterized protein n=1 Tax=viral metagenome TaxID=1070528 RepID=A0A6C0LYL9_9ZZZZ
MADLLTFEGLRTYCDYLVRTTDEPEVPDACWNCMRYAGYVLGGIADVENLLKPTENLSQLFEHDVTFAIVSTKEEYHCFTIFTKGNDVEIVNTYGGLRGRMFKRTHKKDMLIEYLSEFQRDGMINTTKVFGFRMLRDVYHDIQYSHYGINIDI